MVTADPQPKEKVVQDKVQSKFDFTQLIWLVAVLFLVFIIVLPIGYTLYESFTNQSGSLTLSNYNYLSRPYVQEAIFNTILLALGVGFLSVVIGVPLAFGVSRTNMSGKSLVKSAVVISVVTPPFLVSMAYIVLLGPRVGYINIFLRNLFNLPLTSGPIDIFSLWGLIILGLPGGVALVFIQNFPTFANMDPSLEEAARMSGANPLKTILHITLPVMKPAILSGALLACTTALAMYGVPHMLNINVLTIAIRQAFIVLDFKAGATLSTVVIVLSVSGLMLYRWSVRMASRYQTISAKGFRPAVMRLGKSRHLFTALGVVYALFTLILPYGSLIIVSLLRTLGTGISLQNLTLQNYIVVFRSALPKAALLNSVILATGTSTVVVFLGLFVGYLVVRTRMKGRMILDYLSILPMGIAGTALAAGLIIVYLTPPFVRLAVYGTNWILLIAYTTRFTPTGMRFCQSALLQVGKELEESSRVSGANQTQTLRYVTIPLIKNALLFAWILVFIQTLPEISASTLLRGAGTDVISTAILDMWDGTGGMRSASALGVILFVLITVLLILAQKLGGRSYLDASS